MLKYMERPEQCFSLLALNQGKGIVVACPFRVKLEGHVLFG